MEETKDREYLEQVIGTDFGGRTVREYLKEKLHFSERLIARMKYRKDGILLNGVRCRTTAVLTDGDRLRLSVRDPESSSVIWMRPEVILELNILYEDADLLVIFKPEGMVCHPSFGHFRDSLANHAACYLGWEGTSRELHLIGRLDRDTCGLVTVAKNAQAAADLFRQQKEGTYLKTYTALAEGIFREKQGVVDLPLEPVPGVFMLRRTSSEGKPCRTFYEVLGEKGNRTLLQCRLEHGRTHQIRVHMASIGHPLAGDLLYGPGGAFEEYKRTGNPADIRRMNQAGSGREPLGLCASGLSFRQPFTGEELRFQAKLPSWARND